MQPRDHHRIGVDDKISEPGELQFINLSNNYNGDPNTKKAVRKHVMSKFRRDQRRVQSLGKPKDPATGTKSKAPIPNLTPPVPSSSFPSKHTSPFDKSLLGDFQPQKPQLQGNWATRERDIQDDHQESPQDAPGNEAQLIRLPTILGAGRVDPLDTLPLDNSSHTAYLLDHCKCTHQLQYHMITNLIIVNQFITWRVSHLPNTLFGNFFRYSLTDPALAHAMMIYAANHDQFSTGRPRIVDIYHHKVEAIRILNARLRESPINISDETIVTIAELVIFEVSLSILSSKFLEYTFLHISLSLELETESFKQEMFGSSESASTHRAGLRQLVNLRGGIQTLGTPYVSRPFVSQ